MARKNVLVLTIMLLASLILVGISAAQEQEEVVDQPGYVVCDWGLLVTTRSLRTPQSVAATPEVTEAPLDDSGVDHAVNITSPEPNASVAVSTFTVSGTGKGLFENNVVVEVLDAEGTQVFMQPTTMVSEEVGGAGEWSLDVTIEGGKSEFIYAGQPLTIHAYSTSAQDGSIIAEDQVAVVMSPQSTEQGTVFFVADNDTLVQSVDTDLCANAGKQMDYPANVEADVVSVTGIATASLPPQVNVTVTASLSVDCPFPLRALKSQDGGSITIDLFFFFPSDMTCEGEKVATEISLPLGTVSDPDYTVTVNGVAMP
ncbi:MAG: Gmad2 immunoglobulin-like domain-containing protein [Anaerolineae bacterium]|nr:Gmad2 immunoglobulin-like domain-containing protein [Anaerolineae bacterium]